MSEHHWRGRIPPVPERMSRPRWSVMIPTYNCAEYLCEALRSVLAQDPGPDLMQIEVVDDHSTRDDPEAVVSDLGRGRVEFFRQPANVGHVQNFNTCLSRSRGHLIHLLHGDDTVRDGFYRTMERPFQLHPAIGAAFCRYISFDEDRHWQSESALEQMESGVIDDWLDRIAVGQRLQPPSMVVRRDVYERLGGFDSRIRYYGEDWEMWVRIAAEYPVWYETAPLARYRVGAASLSGRSLRTGENMHDLRTVVAINREYLPSDRADMLSGQAHENHALAALRRARRMVAQGDRSGMYSQLREAVRTRPSPVVLASAIKLVIFSLWKTLRPPTRVQW